MNVIGQQIKKFRIEKGYTQEQLGQLLGVSTQAVSKWERGGTPDIELLPDLSEVLGVSIDALFGNNDESELVNLSRRLSRMSSEDAYRHAFHICWAIEVGLMKDVSLIDQFIGFFSEKSGNKTEGTDYYSKLMKNGGISTARISADFRHFFLMTEPAGSIRDHIESNSKHMCAAIILLLQERGLLNVDDTLEKYYPEYGNVKNVTIRNLLTMTTGIKDVTPTELPYHKNATKEQEQEDIDASRRMILSNELQFTPGERHAYTNVNYFLLSDIAKSVSGKDISTLMRENIFEPLKMTHSGTVYELQDSPEWADGYSYDFDNVPINCNMVGSGGVIASASDMQIWLNALPSGKVISAESYAMLTTPFNESIPYGFGISIGKDGAVGHAGFIGSYYSTFDIDLGKKLTVFLASDTIGVETLQDIMFNRILPQIG